MRRVGTPSWSCRPPVGRWDRALLLNLTFWGATNGSGARVGGDILVDRTLPADVVAHVAWHHLAAKHGPALVRPPLGRRPLPRRGDCERLRPLPRRPAPRARSSVDFSRDPGARHGRGRGGRRSLRGGHRRLAQRRGPGSRGLLRVAAAAPGPTPRALLRCRSATDGLRALASFDEHPFAPLLHRYELSNWVLHARAYVADPLAADPAVEALDQALRAAPDAVEHLRAAWVAPALPRGAISGEASPWRPV